MKILWLTIDRSNRVASHIFTGLQNAVKIQSDVQVDFIIRKLNKIAGRFCHQAVNGTIKLDRVLRKKILSRKYDVIFTDAIFAFMTEDWKSIKIPKAVLMEDQHGNMVSKYIGKACNDFDFNMFFVRYKNPTKRFHQYLYKKKVIWLPHSIDPTIFKDYELQKEIGVLSVGNMNERTYPIRNKIHRELQKESYYKNIRRPGEKMDPKGYWPVGVDYAKLINKSKISSSSTSIYNYPVLKFFEIPACRTVLISDYIPELEELGFIPDKNMIRVGKNSNIKKIVESYMENNKKIKSISNEGYKLIHSRHTSDIRAKEFIKSIEENI